MATTAPSDLDQQDGLALGAQAESPCSLVDEASIAAVLSGVVTTEQSETVAYNGFGEIISKTYPGFAGARSE